MFRFAERCPWRPQLLCLAASICLLAAPATVSAQSQGGLYIAGDGFSFQAAAEQGMAKNPHGRRFFLLSLPPETAALSRSAARPLAALRERVLAANGVLLGSPQIAKGQRYFPDENPADLPRANNSLRRLRTTCS